MAHPIKKELDKIINQYYTGQISYPQAKEQIAEAVDGQVEKEKLEKGTEFTYKEIISFGAEKRNALWRLKTKKRNLDRFAKVIKSIKR